MGKNFTVRYPSHLVNVLLGLRLMPQHSMVQSLFRYRKEPNRVIPFGFADLACRTSAAVVLVISTYTFMLRYQKIIEEGRRTAS